MVQSAMLAFGQMALMLALERIGVFSWTWKFWGDLATNWWLSLSGILCGGAMVLWMYILRKFPFSQAYPMGSLSYIFAMVIAVLVLGETVSWNRWLGVGLVVLGCMFVAGK